MKGPEILVLRALNTMNGAEVATPSALLTRITYQTGLLSQFSLFNTI